VFPDLTVAENLNMGAFFLNRAQTEEGMEHVFDLFPRLRERQAQLGGTLSGGEQQMLAIARALLTNGRLLLLDEPSEGLAPLIVDAILQRLKRLKQAGTTVLLSEQNLRFATELADRLLIIERGEIRYTGTPAELSVRPEVREKYLMV
jgi:branched-chain amino acid transport system ATP-binding protein